MTIVQAERFYEQDKKDYELGNNKEFLSWLKSSITDGYHCFMGIDELQKMIDTIANWYEIKYPERELEFYEGIRHMDTDFQDTKRISNVMNIKQLLFRLPSRQYSLMKCGYRARGWSHHMICDDAGNPKLKALIFMHIGKKNVEQDIMLCEELPYFSLRANDVTGDVFVDYDVKEYLNGESNLSLEQLLKIFEEKYADELDFTELKECVYDHDTNMELRHRILQLVALKLLYSRNTIPERGYERAKRFINEFNKKLGLTLSTEEIDEIMNRDYSNGEKWELVTKTFVDENGEEHSYCTVENVNKNDVGNIEDNKGIKGLVKSIFR
ncbi:MAG: hypothetical protein IJI22_06065 [Bacilli bacterium]|nr:hypothetical protein [Bacilli bacterium]